MRTKWAIEGLINGEKRSFARMEITLPSSWNVEMDKEKQIDECWKMFRNLRLVLKRGWTDKRGRKLTFPFECATFWEFGKKTQRIHAHSLIDRAIPWGALKKACVRVGFGARVRLEKIEDKDDATYRKHVEYAAKYVAKGGWNVTVGKKRFDMTIEYRKSVKGYMEKNKKPFDGVITDDFGIAVINEDHIIECKAEGSVPPDPEAIYHLKGELGGAAVAAGIFEADSLARGRLVVERKGVAAMDIRPGRYYPMPHGTVGEPVEKVASSGVVNRGGYGSEEYFRRLDESLKRSS